MAKHSFESIVKGWVVPAIAGCAGLFLLAASVTEDIPSQDELREIEGELLRYDVFSRSSGRRRNRPVIILSVANQASRFWTDAVTKESAVSEFSAGPGEVRHFVEVRFFVRKIPTKKPVDGDAIKSYGLWVNGRAIRTLEAAIERDRFFVRVVFPVLGAVLVALAVLLHRKTRRAFVREG